LRAYIARNELFDRNRETVAPPHRVTHAREHLPDKFLALTIALFQGREPLGKRFCVAKTLRCDIKTRLAVKVFAHGQKAPAREAHLGTFRKHR
jgi:hypothetical protein